MMAELPPADMVDYVKVSIGLFAPRYDEDFNMTIADSITVQAIARCFNSDPSVVNRMVRETGDYGDVAVKIRSSVGPGHELSAILNSMSRLNELVGEDSVDSKI